MRDAIQHRFQTGATNTNREIDNAYEMERLNTAISKTTEPCVTYLVDSKLETSI